MVPDTGEMKPVTERKPTGWSQDPERKEGPAQVQEDAGWITETSSSNPSPSQLGSVPAAHVLNQPSLAEPHGVHLWNLFLLLMLSDGILTFWHLTCQVNFCPKAFAHVTLCI